LPEPWAFLNPRCANFDLVGDDAIVGLVVGRLLAGVLHDLQRRSDAESLELALEGAVILFRDISDGRHW